MTKHHDCLRKHAYELLNKPGVFAVGLGEKISNGQPTGKQALICSIAKKVPLAQLAEEDKIPKDIDGVPTDIIEIGERPRAFATKEKHRPVTPGTSCAHYKVTAGTIGAFVEVDGQTMILSNNHVLANTNDCKLGDAILQPGKYDGGKAVDQVATLYWYCPLTYTTQQAPTPYPDPAERNPTAPPAPPAPPPEETAPPPKKSRNFIQKIFDLVEKILRTVLGLVFTNVREESVEAESFDLEDQHEHIEHGASQAVIRNKVDCALAVLDPGVEYTNNYLGFIPKVEGVNEMAGVGTDVHKLGRTTGYTTGVIKQTNVVVDVQYDGGICRFENQIMIQGPTGQSFSKGGDSGSLILDMDNNAVGLLFAGNDVTTFANPIGSVIQELKITKFL